jgi:hypothetical protein
MLQKLPFLSPTSWTLIFFCALMLGFTSSQSLTAQEVRISVNSTAAKQGEHLSVEVSGSVSDAPLDSMRIVFTYNANRLKIDSVRGGEGFALQCREPLVTDKVLILDGTLEISCGSVKQTTDGRLIVIYCTVLAGLGTEAEISPKECFVNGIKKEGILIPGKITIDDIPATVKFRESIGLPFENPSYATLRIPYTIDTPTKVSFTIYDLTGRVVEEIPAVDRTQGYYVFDYIPTDGVFANGPYFVKMTTENNVFFTYFMRLR